MNLEIRVISVILDKMSTFDHSDHKKPITVGDYIVRFSISNRQFIVGMQTVKEQGKEETQHLFTAHLDSALEHAHGKSLKEMGTTKEDKRKALAEKILKLALKKLKEG